MFKDRTLLGLISAVFLMMIGVGMIVALLPQRIVDLDGNGKNIGYLASAFALSYILFQIPIGNLSDKFGFKPFLVIGYFLCCITGLLFYFSHSSNTIFGARFLQGIGEAPIWALAPALLSIKFPLTKGKVMGIYNAAIHLGLTLGPITGVLLTKVWQNNEVFLVYAFVCFLGAVLITLFVENMDTKEPQMTESLDLNNLFILLKDRKTLISLMGITIYGTGYGIFLSTIPAFLIEARSFSSLHIGIFFSLFYVAISLSQIISGPFTDRFGRKLFMIVGLSMAAAGAIMASLINTLWILSALTFASLGLGIFYLSSMTFLNETVANHLKGTISGAYYLFWGVGMFFGPPILTMIADYTTFDFSLMLYSFVMLVIACLMKIIL